MTSPAPAAAASGTRLAARLAPGSAARPGGRLAARPRFRLAPRWRTLLVTLHVVTSVGLLGADAAVLALAVSGRLGSAPITVYPAADVIATVLVLPCAVLALASGVALGLLTRWGLVRHWWVLLKLVLTVAGTLLAIFVLVPTVEAAAGAALAGEPIAEPSALVKDSGGASGVLVVIILLAYYKPFGRIRRQP